MTISGVILCLTLFSAFVLSTGIPRNVSTTTPEVVNGKEHCSPTGFLPEGPCKHACFKGCPYTGASQGYYNVKDGILQHHCVCGDGCSRPESSHDVIHAVKIWISAVEKYCSDTYCGVKYHGIDESTCVFLGKVIRCKCKAPHNSHDAVV